MTDEEVYVAVHVIEDTGIDYLDAVAFAAEDLSLTVEMVKDAYQRHIDSEAPVSDPKPLRDGTEEITIDDTLRECRRLLSIVMDNLAAVAEENIRLREQAAGTERMSRLAKELGIK